MAVITYGAAWGLNTVTDRYVAAELEKQEPANDQTGVTSQEEPAGDILLPFEEEVTITGEDTEAIPEDLDFSELTWVFEDEEGSGADLLTPAELPEEHMVSDMKVVNYGARKYFNWHVRFRESAFSKSIPMKSGQYLNITCTYNPCDTPAYFGYVGPDKVVHLYNCISGKCTKTICVTRTGDYYVCFKNMAKLQTVYAMGSYRVGT